LVSRDGIARAGASNTRTGSLLFPHKLALLGLLLWLLLERSLERDEFTDLKEPNLSSPIIRNNSSAQPSNTSAVVLEEDKKTETSATPSTVEIEYYRRPLAFYTPPVKADWNEEQLARLAMLREEFAAALGGWEQDATDPDYREKWIRAQPWVDEQFETIFGSEALNEQQLQAIHRSP
jgi:hypothetical protein